MVDQTWYWGQSFSGKYVGLNNLQKFLPDILWSMAKWMAAQGSAVEGAYGFWGAVESKLPPYQTDHNTTEELKTPPVLWFIFPERACGKWQADSRKNVVTAASVICRLYSVSTLFSTFSNLGKSSHAPQHNSLSHPSPWPGQLLPPTACLYV